MSILSWHDACYVPHFTPIIHSYLSMSNSERDYIVKQESPRLYHDWHFGKYKYWKDLEAYDRALTRQQRGLSAQEEESEEIIEGTGEEFNQKLMAHCLKEVASGYFKSSDFAKTDENFDKWKNLVNQKKSTGGKGNETMEKVQGFYFSKGLSISREMQQRGEHEEAVKVLTHSISKETNPEHRKDLLYRRSESHLQLANYERAHEDYKEFAKISTKEGAKIDNRIIVGAETNRAFIHGNFDGLWEATAGVIIDLALDGGIVIADTALNCVGKSFPDRFQSKIDKAKLNLALTFLAPEKMGAFIAVTSDVDALRNKWDSLSENDRAYELGKISGKHIIGNLVGKKFSLVTQKASDVAIGQKSQ